MRQDLVEMGHCMLHEWMEVVRKVGWTNRIDVRAMLCGEALAMLVHRLSHALPE